MRVSLLLLFKRWLAFVFLFTLAFAPGIAAGQSWEHLLHRYNFTNTLDSVGAANATLFPGAVISNGAVVLDGVSGYVELPDDLVTNYSSITVEMWVTDNGSVGWSRVFDFGRDTAHYMFLSLPAGTGNLRGAYNSGAGEQILEWIGARPPAGQRLHLVWTTDSNTQTGRLYVDGVLVGENLAMTQTPSGMGSMPNTWLGRSQYPDPFWRGTIDELRLYDIAMTPDEVLTNFQSGPDKLLFGPVYIVTQPQNQIVNEASPVVFTGDAGGSPPIALQWFRNGVALPGETNGTLAFVAALTNNNNTFQLRATNVFNSTTFFVASATATLSVVSDTNPPVLLRAQSASTNGVDVFFSERVRPDTGTNLGNYTLSGPSGAVAISSASLDASGTIVTLGTGPLLAGSNYTVFVSGVRDLVGNLIAPGSTGTFNATIYVVRDIGSPAVTGAIQGTTNGVALTAGGTGLGATSDQFTLAYQTRTGDFDVQIRLGSLGLSDLWATAGLMARDGLASNAVFAASLATPGPAGSFFQSRTNVGAGATQSGSFPVNYPNTWLRLQRVGNVFNGYASLDGSAWYLLGSATLSVSSTLQVGIAVSSHNAAQATSTSVANAGNTTSPVTASAPLPFEPLAASSRRSGLVFSEIMYHPDNGTNLGTAEFVELYNSDLISENLTGCRLSGDIDYTFPPGTILPSGGYLVIAREPATVQARYGISGVLGPFTNSLPNSSGTLRLRNELDSVLLEVEYHSTMPWPVAADGAGHSLVLRRASYGENDPRAWAASDVVGGSPGTGDAYGAEPLRGVLINEVLAHTDLPEVDEIELFNSSSQPLNLSGCVLTDDPTTNRYVIGNVVIPARGFVFFTETQIGFRFDASGESVFLKNPSGTRVLDAVRFDAQENGVSSGRWPNGGSQWRRLSAKTFGAANTGPRFSKVGFNEIMYHPLSGDDGLQYVELFNRGPGAVNLSGWKIKDGISFTFPSNTVLNVNTYLVVANDAARLIPNYANLNTTNTLGNFGGSLSHRGERLALTMPDDIITTNGAVVVTNQIDITVDEVTYLDGGRWGQWSDGGGSSLELTDPRSDHGQASNWADSDETSKAPWTLIERTDLTTLGSSTTGNGTPNRFEFFLQGPGECLVDDMEVRSNGGANQIANPGFEAGTNGWAFQGTHSRTVLETGQAFSGTQSLRVKASERGDTGANRIRTAIPTVPVNSGNQATLRAHVRWLRGDPNILLRLRGNWLECAGVMTVPLNLGTPGAINSRLAPNAGPVITDVTHLPVLPAGGVPVVVSARVEDPDGVGPVAVYYRIDPSGTYGGVLMNDNGTGGDAFANDRIFSATIPPQAADAVVGFYLLAQDSALPSSQSRFPNDAPTRECLVHYGDTVRSGSMGTYRLWMSQSNLTTWATREKNSNEGLDATFVYGGSRVVYNAQTLYSGSPWHTPSYNGPLGSFVCNYQVELPTDDRVLGAQSFNLEGQSANEGSTFNNDITAQAETTAHWMARHLGVQPDYRRYIFVTFNGQQRGMLYYDYQQPNGDVVEEYFPDDSNGHLHKIEDWFEFDDNGAGQSIVTATLQNFSVGGVKRTERYRWNWRPRATEAPNEFADLFSLVDAANAPGPEPYTSATLNLADVSEWMRMFAVEHMSGDWDSYGYERGKNMFAYKPTKGPWRLLLWDIQLVFGKSSRGTSDSLFSGHDPVINRMYAHPPFLREYWAAYSELVNGPMLPANYYPLLDARYAALRAHSVPVQDPISVKNWIDARRSFIAAQIPASSFSVSGPASFSSSSNRITLSGIAPLNAGTILVNGANYPLTWSSISNWSVQVTLATNSNLLVVNAVDRGGNPIGTNSVIVTYTGPVVVPEGNVVINEIMHGPALPGAGYVELFNTHSNFTFDLSNWRVNGLGYNFPPGSILPPRSFLVLAEDVAAYAATYSATNVPFDRFEGGLDSDGETLTLFRPGSSPTNEIVVDRVRYEAAAPWPAWATNGISLQLADSTQDNSRVANWRTLPASTNINNPTSQWIYVTSTASISVASPRFYFYIESAGEIFIDDAKLVAGAVPEAGANLLSNGDFETTLSPPWTLSADFATSVISTAFKHSGNSSLRMIATAPGTGQNDSVFQNFPVSIPAGAYSLSFWYMQNTNGNPLTARLSGSVVGNGLAVSLNPLLPPASVVITLGGTPGQSNSVQTNLAAFPLIWLNEVQADNVTGPVDNFLEHDPWVELYNAGSNAFNLSGYYLTDTYTNLTKWAFPASASIPAKGFLVVWCDNQTNQSTVSIPHTSFRLGSGAGAIALARITNGGPQVVDYLNYTNLPTNWSYDDLPDGQPFFRGNAFFTTPGATNSAASVPITVFINEWLADNTQTLTDPADNNFEDWFELYNPGTNTVDLGGYFLTDNLTNKTQFAVPANGQYVIPPGGYLLVWADNEANQNSTNRADLHASFALSKGGEAIGLFAADGTAIDAVSFGAQTSDVSQGRFPNGAANIYSMPTPTPRAANVLPNTPPVLGPITNRVLTLGQGLSFTVGATDADQPPQALSFSLTGAPPGANVHPVSGLFTWTPNTAPSTNSIGVVVADNGAPSLSATQFFTVIVALPPQVNGYGFVGSQFRFSWATVPGQKFQVEFKSALTNAVWTPVGSPLTGTGVPLSFTNNPAGATQRFFRLRIVP